MNYLTSTLKYSGILVLILVISLAFTFYFLPRDTNPTDAAWAVGIWSGASGVVLGRLAGWRKK